MLEILWNASKKRMIRIDDVDGSANPFDFASVDRGPAEHTSAFRVLSDQPPSDCSGVAEYLLDCRGQAVSPRIPSLIQDVWGHRYTGGRNVIEA